MSELESPFKFRLRSEILMDGMSLRDPLSGAAYLLDEVGRMIAKAIHSPLEAGELASDMEVACGASRAKVERELRQMLLLGLVDGTCDSARQRLERMRGGERPMPRVLEGSRFGCQNSGACCRGYVFGSIREKEKLRIESLDPREALPRLGDGPLFVEAGVRSGEPTYRLATVGDSCVFLEDGPRCGLHRAFGASAKPALCQLYPLSAVATIDSLRIYDRGECATFAVSARTGILLEEDIPRIRALLDEEIYHPTVQFHGSWRCDYGAILALSQRLDKELNCNSPLHALHAIGHVTRAFIVALVKCPFEAGQPETAVARRLERPTAEFRPAEAAVSTNARAGLRTLAVLADALVQRVARTETLGPLFIEAASLLAEICRTIVHAAPMSDRGREALAIPMGDDCESAMRLSLRQQLFGRELVLDDHLPAGLLRMAFVATLTLTGARLRALDEGRKRVLPHHFSAGHMTTKRTINRPEPHALLRANGEQSWPILDAMPLLDRDLGFKRD